MSSRTAARLTLLALVAATAGAGACARSQITPTTNVVVDPEPAEVTPSGDLEILRFRAAMGMAGDVRAELTPRIASAGDRPDRGRDALRRLAIQLALVQGDGEAARTQLAQLSRDITSLGTQATAEDRAQLDLLSGRWLHEQGKYADARGKHLRALANIDGPADSSLIGTALRGLADDMLALGDAKGALATLSRALEIHTNASDAAIELHEDLLLAVDVMIALDQPDEARILAGDAYNQALKQFGPDTLPHAEALLQVGAASLAAEDKTAGASVVADAGAIFDKLQSERTDPRFPVSARVVRRLFALRTALGPAESAGSTGS